MTTQDNAPTIVTASPKYELSVNYECSWSIIATCFNFLVVVNGTESSEILSRNTLN